VPGIDERQGPRLVKIIDSIEHVFENTGARRQFRPAPCEGLKMRALFRPRPSGP
jgi:hypothetical protein